MADWLDQYHDNSALSRLLESLPSGVVATDAQGRGVWLNAAARRLLELSGESWQGQTVEKLLGWPGERKLPELGSPAELVTERAGATRRVWRLTRQAAPSAGELWFIEDRSEADFLRQALLLAEYREQRRLGQVLHDNLSGQLLGAAFSAQLAANKLSRQGEVPTAEELQELAKMVNESAAHLREITADPATRAAAEGNLPEALRALARQQRRAQVEIVITDESLIDTGRHTSVLLGLVREAVNDAVAAGSPQVTVLLRARPDSTDLKILANPTKSGELNGQAASMAWRLFEFRCQAIGAVVTFHVAGTQTPAGTTINLSLPQIAL